MEERVTIINLVEEEKKNEWRPGDKRVNPGVNSVFPCKKGSG
jgi:hypothetical protein